VIDRSQAKQVELVDIQRAYRLFLDVTRSVEYLKESEQQFLFSETKGGAGGASEPDVMPMVAE